MADQITLRDLNAFAERIESNARAQISDLRDEMLRMEKGVYHRIDEIKQALADQEDRNDQQDRILNDHALGLRDVQRGVKDITDQTISQAVSEAALGGAGVASPSLLRTYGEGVVFTGRQKVGMVALALSAVISISDMLGHLWTFGVDLLAKMHR